jgi:hypothetical protein
MGPVMEVLNRAAQMIENCKLKNGYGNRNGLNCSKLSLRSRERKSSEDEDENRKRKSFWSNMPRSLRIRREPLIVYLRRREYRRSKPHASKTSGVWPQF